MSTPEQRRAEFDQWIVEWQYAQARLQVSALRAGLLAARRRTFGQQLTDGIGQGVDGSRETGQRHRDAGPFALGVRKGYKVGLRVRAHLVHALRQVSSNFRGHGRDRTPPPYTLTVTIAPACNPARVGREVVEAIAEFERAGGRR